MKDSTEGAALARAFLLTWTAAAFLHFADKWDSPEQAFISLGICAMAYFIPQIRIAWFLCLGLLIALFLPSYPRLANHSNFVLISNFFLVAAGFHFPLNLKTIARSLLLGLSVVYLWAAVNKMNTDYFYPDVSCAYDMVNRVFKRYFGGPAELYLLEHFHLPELGILVELLAPILLFFRRTFFAGLLLALGLHLLLATVGFVDFSAVALSVMSFYAVTHLEMKTGVESTRRLHSRMLKVITFYFLAALAAGLLSGALYYAGHWRQAYYSQVLVFVISVVTMIGVLAKSEREEGVRSFHVLAPPRMAFKVVALPLFLLLFGLQGYLGLSTHGSFSMFSNLRTEGGHWNHFFMPKALQVFDLQDEILFFEEIEPNISLIRGRLIEKMGETALELDRKFDHWRKNGIKPKSFKLRSSLEPEVIFEARERFPEGFGYSWLAKKLVAHRPVQPEGPNRCRR